MPPVAGLDSLWHATLGDPRVGVAILDGPVDLTHSSFAHACVDRLPGLVSSKVDLGFATRHGTHVASLIFGQHHGPMHGVAPGCRGLLLTVFASASDDRLRPCSQLDLARAITAALAAGAHVINISGGEFTPGGQAHPLLADVVQECSRRGVLIVAAAGNDGCACLHVPAALDSVLAIGAMDGEGEPLPSSNWGGAYQHQGIVAPGQDILGAHPGGGTSRLTGTSSATALVSGVVALLLSLQLRLGVRPDPQAVRRALLASAVDCRTQLAWDCPRLLVGRLNLSGAIEYLLKDRHPMSLVNENSGAEPAIAAAVGTSCADTPRFATAPAFPVATPSAAGVRPSACGCDDRPTQKAYALGQLGYDLISEARLDAMAQRMAENGTEDVERFAPLNHKKFHEHLQKSPSDAASVEWILLLDGTPIYALRPQGPFAAETYKMFIAFVQGQLEEGVERISVPGVVSGQAQLFMGQTVPVLVPEMRGMYSWSTKELVKSAHGEKPGDDAHAGTRADYEKKAAGVTNFLDKVYYGLRNLGALPQDRALNFAATNAYNFESIYESAVKEQMELESINVVRSPYCRPGSDCWDVEVYFFYPDRQVQTVRRVYRFTVDVSDIVPVTVGPTRSWFTR